MKPPKPHRTAGTLLAILTLLGTGQSAPGQDPGTSPPAAGQDADGSPLPKGAFARFGTIRFRNATSARAVGFLGPRSLYCVLPDRWISVLEWPGGKRLFRVSGDREALNCVAGAAAGDRIVFGAATGRVALLNAATGRWIADLPAVGYVTNVLAASPDGRAVACGGSDGAVHVRRLEGGEEVRLLKAGTGPVVDVSWSASGAIAALCRDGRLVVFGSEDKPLLSAEGQELGRKVALSPDGSAAWVAGGTSQLRRWDLRKPGEPSATAAGEGELLWVEVSPDSKFVAAGGEDGQLRIWDALSLKPHLARSAHIGALRSLSWSPDGKALLTVGDDRSVRAFDPSTGTDLAPAPGHVETVTCLALSPDGRRLATGGADGRVHLWDSAAGKFLFSMKPRTEPIHGLAWSPDGGRVAFGSGKRVTVVEAREGAVPKDLDAGAGGIRSVAWLPGKGVLAGGSDTVVRLLDADSGRPLGEYRAHDALVRSVAAHPAGTHFVSTGADLRSALWTLPDVKPVWLETQRKSVTCSAFSRDGSLLATGGGDACVRIWEVPSGKLRVTVRGFDGELTGVAFSPDGSLVAGSAVGNSVRVCKADGGAEVVVFHGMGGETRGVCWGGDATTLYSAMFDTTAVGWRIPAR